MEVKKILEDRKLKIEIAGRLDTTNSPELDAIIKESLDDADDIIFDFEKLEYISSAGLRVLLSTFKAMKDKGDMVITNVSDVIMDIFEITGFAGIFTIE